MIDETKILILEDILDKLVEIEEDLNVVGECEGIAKILNARGVFREDGIYQYIQRKLEVLQQENPEHE